MYICMYVCMYVCMHACMCVYIYLDINTCLHTHIHIYVYIYTYTYECKLHVYGPVRVKTYICTGPTALSVSHSISQMKSIIDLTIFKCLI